jgi:hypothetical protein
VQNSLLQKRGHALIKLALSFILVYPINCMTYQVKQDVRKAFSSISDFIQRLSLNDVSMRWKMVVMNEQKTNNNPKPEQTTNTEIDTMFDDFNKIMEQGQQ